jgi:hypothetical protein
MPISTMNGKYIYNGVAYNTLQEAKAAEMRDSTMTINPNIPAGSGAPIQPVPSPQTRQPMSDQSMGAALNMMRKQGGLNAMQDARQNKQYSGRGEVGMPAKPAGLLDTPTPQTGGATQTQPSFMDRLTSAEGLGGIGSMMLAMSNNPNLAKLGQMGMAQMQEKRAGNRTLEFLKAKGVDDETLEALKNNPQMINAYASSLLKAPKSYAAQENYKLAKAQGYKGSFIDYQKEMALAGAGVELGAGKDYLKDANKYLVERLGGMMDNMDSARSKQIQLQTLDKLLSESPTGFAGAAKNWLGNFGIETEGLDNIQAANAIINQLVPQQRPAGSGPMSDKDLEMFKASLPRLINTPEGNRKIMETLKMINNYEMEIGRIAESAMYGELTPQEARERMKSLENPLGWVRGDSGSSAEQQQWVRDPETGKLVLKSG